MFSTWSDQQSIKVNANEILLLHRVLEIIVRTASPGKLPDKQLQASIEPFAANQQHRALSDWQHLLPEYGNVRTGRPLPSK